MLTGIYAASETTAPATGVNDPTNNFNSQMIHGRQ